MKHFRFILPVFLATFFLFSSAVWAALPSAFSVIPATTSDTANIDSSVVNGSYTNVPALGIKINEAAAGTGDTLYSITVHSMNDRHYSVKAIKLWKDKGAAGFSSSQDSLMKTFAISGPFHENDSIKISGINLIMANGTSPIFYFTYDMDPDSVKLWSVWNNYYCGLKIHPMGIEMKNAGYGPAVGDTLQYPAPRRIRIDTYPPLFEDLYFTLYDQSECGGFNGIVDLGDSIRVAANISGGDVEVSAGVKADFSTFKAGTPVVWQTLTDSIISSPAGDSNFVSRHRIPLAQVARPIDVLSGFYYLVFTCQDTVGNLNRDSLLVMYPIDTEKPKFDSVRVDLYWDKEGDGVISIGDTLKFWAWMESNEFFEVDSVRVDLDSIILGWMVSLEDTAGEKIWQMKAEVGSGLIDTAANQLACWFHAWDNACNTDSARELIGYPIDISPPTISASDIILQRWVDVDSNNVMNIGDTVLIRVSATNVPDLAVSCPVMVNLLERLNGFEGPWNYCMAESASTSKIYRLLWELGDEPQDSAVDKLANVAYVRITLEDDAGNTSIIASNPIDKKVDTKRPVPVGGLVATPMKDCVVDLTWTTQDSDLSGGGWFAIFSDWGLGGLINYDDTMGTTNDITHKKWTTDGTVVLNDSTTYKFVVMTIDNANNWEKPADTVVVSAHADCKPPVVCITYPESGTTWGPNWDLQLIAQTKEADVCSVLLVYRQKDSDGMGTPGPWIRKSKMDTTPPYAGTYIFKDTITSLPKEGLFEMIAYAYDCAGNVLDTMAAYDSCHFEFYWYSTSTPVYISSINDTVSAQSSCGFNVSGNANTVVIDVAGATATDSFNVEAFAYDTLIPGYPPPMNKRIYRADMVTMPHSFNLDVTNWPAGTHKFWVYAWDKSKNWGRDSAFVCVPEWQVPMAYMSYPKDGQRVHIVKSVMPPYNLVALEAQLSGNSPFTASQIGKVEFEYSLNDTDWVWIGTDLGPSSGIWSVKWDNSDPAIFHDGQKVWLRAKFYLTSVPKATVLADGFGVTDPVYVFLDSSVPVVHLLVQPIVTINGVDKISGPVDLFAYVKQSTIDIKYVSFYWKNHTDPDIFFKYNLIGKVVPVNSGDPDSATIFAYRDWPGGSDQSFIDIRAIPEDQAGNVLFDYDGDMLFDDGWFNPANPGDTTLFRDEEGPQPAIDTIFSIAQDGSDTIMFINPSDELGGSDVVFVQADRWIGVTTHCLPAGDSLEVEKVVYDVDGDQIGTRTTAPYRMKFWPPDYDFDFHSTEGYISFDLTAYMYDKLGNSAESDGIEIYILDITGNQVVITTPKNNSYNKRDISLTAAALNAAWDDIKAVTYQYGVITSSMFKGAAQQETTWYDIARVPTSMPQAAMLEKSVITIPTWPATWETFNNDLNHNGDFTDDDGWYFMRAVSEDSAGNTAIGPMLKVNVTNHDPVAYMIVPPDSVVGPNMNVRGQTDISVQANVEKYSTNSAGIDYVRFGTKSQTSSSWNWLPFLNPDSLTTHLGTLYTRMWAVVCGPGGSEWLHVSAEAYDSAGNVGYADTLNIFKDCDEPNGDIVAINGDHNTYMKDITPLDTALIVARAWDLPADYNAGIDTIQFYIESRHNDGYSYLGTPLGPDADGQYWLTWNHAGLPADTYDVQMYLVDKVNNSYWSASAPMIIRDITVPVGVVRAFHPYYIFASTENPVDYLQIQYQPYTGALGGSGWIDLGLATTYGSYDDLWWTPWVPTSLAGTENEEYLFRAVPLRGWVDKQGVQKFAVLDNFVAPTVHVLITPEGEVILPEETADIGSMSFVANNLASDSKGTATFIQTTQKPYLLVIYSDLSGDVKNAVVTDVLEESGATNRWNSVFNVTDINAIGGTAEFHASIYDVSLNKAYIERNGFDITKVTVDLGTNGWITSMDTYVKINIPAGAVDDTLNLVIFPTEKPVYIPNSCKEYIPIGNENGLLEKFCLYDFGSSLSSGPGSGGIVESLETGFGATLYYSEAEVTGDEANLVVGWFNPSTNCWEFDGIMDPVVNTENNSISFLGYQLGLYAVLAKGSPITATIELEPNCSGYTYKYPLFKAVIQDENMDVDASTIVVRYRSLGGAWMMAYQNNCYTADFHHPHDFHDGYDVSSGILKLVKIQPFAPGTYEVEVKARNINGILAADTATFTVETSTPMVNVPNGYVYKNPSFTFTVKDTGSGVDRNMVFVDLYSVTKSDSNTTWYRKYIETITPTSMEWLNDTTVKVSTTYFLRTGQYLDVVVYNGEWSHSYGYPGDYDYRAYDLDDGVNDCVGNEAYIVEKRFTVDWAAPTITLLSNRWVTPLLFRVIDNECGVTKDRIVITEDGVLASPDSFTYDPATGILTYRPPTSGAVVNITVTDCVGNATYYPPFFAISDDAAPNVVFVGGNELYKAKDPTVKVRVYDVGGAGIDWDSVKVDVWKGDYLFVTLGPTDVKNALSGDTIIIKLPDYTDATDLRVVVYSYKSGTSSYPYMADYYKKGVYDLAGNYASPAYHSWKVDAGSPVITLLSGLDKRPIVIQITDGGSGIDWTTLNVTVDGNAFEVVDTSIDMTTGRVNLHIEDGNFEVMITVTDKVGNTTAYTFTTEAAVLTLEHAYNWPNPFDPRNEETTIEIVNSKSAEITVKIFDFGGDYVTTIVPNNGAYRWKGQTEKGEMVANGIYLCHIKAKDGASTVTKVIKIAVVKKD